VKLNSKKILNKFVIEMMNDPETKDFGLYFERMYAKCMQHYGHIVTEKDWE